MISSCLICLLIVLMYPNRARKFPYRNNSLIRRPPTDTTVTTSSAGTGEINSIRRKENKFKQIKTLKKRDNNRVKCPHVIKNTQFVNPSYNTMDTTTVVQKQSN